MQGEGGTRRWILALLAWATYVVVLAPACFFLVIFLAGPHSSLLPSFLYPVVVIVGLGVLFVAPILVAPVVWRRATRDRWR